MVRTAPAARVFVLATRFIAAGLVAARLPAQQPADSTRPETTRAAAMIAAARAITPVADQAQGVDTELRAALFELVSDRPLAALDRLERLRAFPAALAAPGSDSLRTRGDLLFLLSESYYRLGMSGAFRTTAQELAAAPGGARYGGVIDVQLMLDAYRRGEYVRVRELAARAPASPSGGEDHDLALLLSGLAASRTGDYTAARTAFATVRAAGGPYAPYAQFMDVFAAMGGDTARVGAALEAIRPLAEVATRVFGDHVRLTAAELAYESGQYDAAITFANGVGATSGLAAQALLTKAWAQYHAGQLDTARATFADFAARYPLLPERDEARLMVGQAMLEAGHTAEAEAYFQTIADSMSAEAAALQAGAADAVSGAAQALVAAHSAGIAFLDAPEAGQTLALPDTAGADAATMLAAFTGAPAPLARRGPEVVSLTDVLSRVDTLAPSLGAAFPRRLLFAGSATPAIVAAYTMCADTLVAADVGVALAQSRLQQQLDAHAAAIAALEDMQRLIASSTAELATDAAIIAATQDSLDRMKVVLERSRQRVREALETQVQATRRMAAENLAMVDSVRASLGTSNDSATTTVLSIEAQTAARYQQIADTVGRALDGAIAHHPAFALRDSLDVRLARARALHDDAAAVLAADDQLVKSELATLRGSEPDRTRALRAALAAAQSARSTAEQHLVALVDNELRARATSMLALLHHDREAADYGSASAAFFRATESAGAGGAAPAAKSAPTPTGTPRQ